MAVWSQIKYHEAKEGNRFDAEYYQPDNLSLLATLQKSQPTPLGELAFVTDGIHASPEVVEDGGVRYLSAKCVKDNDFALAVTLFISDQQNAANPRTQLRAGDVLVTTVGTIGNAAVVQPDCLPANADRHLGIVRLKETCGIDPYFLTTFLNSRYGRFQTWREATGNVQLNLFIDKIKNLLVPIMSFQKAVAGMTKRAYDKRREAEVLYAATESDLNAALGLDRVDLAPKLFYTDRLSQISSANRLDAEYACVPDISRSWKPSFPLKPLGDSTITQYVRNGLTPAAEDYGNIGKPIIKVGDMTNHGFVEFGGEYVLPHSKVYDAKKGAVRPGDILVLAAAHHIRYIGKTSLLADWPTAERACQAVGELLLIRTSEMITPEVLTTYLNLQLIRLQVQRLVRGMSAHLYPNDLGTLPVPLVPTEIQERISTDFRKAIASRQESRRLLETAKRAVEIAIEDGEEAARKFLAHLGPE